jgi:hypothetical protein
MTDPYLESFLYDLLHSDLSEPLSDDFFDTLSCQGADASCISAETRGRIVRQVGPLSAEERHHKVVRYIDKRARRVWTKKINYDCRKKVADHRLRIKGRFITKEQAHSLGLDD